MTTTATATRTNTYAGVCSDCGTHVAAQAGPLGAKVNGRWTVRHTTCPTINDMTVRRVALPTARPARSYATECDAGHRHQVRGCFFCDNQIGW